jgi:hypothetical protein
MKIIEQNASKLSIQITTPLWIALLFGIGFLLSGITALFFLVQTNNFTCQRLEPNQGQCKLSTWSLLGEKSQTFDIHDLQGANLEITYSREARTESIKLITTRGDITLKAPDYFQDKQETVDQINAFVSDPNITTLTIKTNIGAPILGCFFSAVFIIPGLVMLLRVLKADIFTFDKMTRKLTWTRQGIINARVQEYAFHQIQDVQVKKNRYHSRNSRAVSQYQIYLIMTNDKKIHLNFFAPTRNKKEAEKIAWLITAALEGADAGSTTTSNTIEDSLDLSVLKK